MQFEQVTAYEFFQWLAGRDMEQVIGMSTSARQCPIATMLSEQVSPSGSVQIGSVNFVIVDPFAAQLVRWGRVSWWVAEFVGRLDSLHGRRQEPVTVGECLVVLLEVLDMLECALASVVPVMV